MDRPLRRRVRLADILATAAVAALLAYLLLPTFQRARPTARNHMCAEGLRSLGRALQLYAQDNSSWFPGHNVAIRDPGDVGQLARAMEYPRRALSRYISDDPWTCFAAPSDPVGHFYPGFGYVDEWQHPSAYGLSNVPAAWDREPVHAGGRNVLYADGHVAMSDAKLMAVRADREWQPTGVEVGEGQGVRIEAAGQWTHNGARPDRQYPPCGAGPTAPADNLAPYWPDGSLLGRVESEQFHIGHFTERALSATGELLLCMNQSTTGSRTADNLGVAWALVALTDASPPAADPAALGDEFTDGARWESAGEDPSQFAVSDGELHLRQKTARLPVARQMVSALIGECDIEVRMRVDTPPGGPEYGPDGGVLYLSLRRDGQDGTEELEVRMSCYEQADGQGWQVVLLRPGEFDQRHRLGRYVPSGTWHDVEVNVRRTWVRVEADGETLGSAPFSLPLETPVHLVVSATSGDAHIDYIRLTSAPATHAAGEFE